MKCAEVREVLPALARDADASRSVRRHLSACPGCAAELARYEALLTALGSLSTETVDVPPTLLASLIAIPSQWTRRAMARRRAESARGHLARNRRVYLGGTAAAVAVAGAAGATLWRNRSRRLVTA